MSIVMKIDNDNDVGVDVDVAPHSKGNVCVAVSFPLLHWSTPLLYIEYIAIQ